jgi:Ca2+-binding RTX toxin-like protein
MNVKSVGRIALGSSASRTSFRVLIAVIGTIATGVGSSTATPGAHARVIEGSAGDDQIVGTAQGDQIFGQGGNDVVSARGGGDTVSMFSIDGLGEGNDEISTGLGTDQVESGGGDDVIRLGPNPRRWDYADPGEGNDTVLGGPGRDSLQDFNSSRTGSDDLRGGWGADSILTTSGRETVFGGPGNDFFSIYADGSVDQIDCGPGFDTLEWVHGHERHDLAVNCERVRVEHNPG